jgi:ribonuclease J
MENTNENIVVENTTTQNNTVVQNESTQEKPKGKTAPQKKKPPTSGNGWTNDTKKSFEINEKIQKDRLNPHNKLNLKTEASVKITPLGGLGEIGGNMMVIETDKSAIIIDVGMSFPDETMHGVDILFLILHI